MIALGETELPPLELNSETSVNYIVYGHNNVPYEYIRINYYYTFE